MAVFGGNHADLLVRAQCLEEGVREGEQECEMNRDHEWIDMIERYFQ